MPMGSGDSVFVECFPLSGLRDCTKTLHPSCLQLFTFSANPLPGGDGDELLSQSNPLGLMKVTSGISAEGESAATLFHVQKSAPFSVKFLVHLLLS